MEFFAKIVKNYNYCCKVLLSFIVSSDRHIHGLFRYIQPYCGTFRTLCNSCIFTTLPYLEPKTFRTLSGHILAYSDSCVTLGYRELCHIQKFGVLRTRGIFRILFILFMSVYSIIIIRHLFFDHNDLNFYAQLGLLKQCAIFENSVVIE